MTTICEDLRKAVLQAAIQGRLTPQLPEDGNAEDLYKEIQAEKQRLIQEGKIKKEKPLPPITEDDIPFDIPESWKWVHTGEVVKNVQYGTAKKSSKSGLVPVLRMGNIQKGKIDYSSLVYTSDADEINHYALQKDDLLFNRTNSREQVGKVAIYKAEKPAIYAGYLVRITPIQFNSDYLNYVMQTSYYWEYCQAVKSDAIGQSNINAEKLKNFVFPFPPLAEQKRIVARVDELMKKIDEMEKTEKDIKALYDAFPGDMKVALLQAAIQGKLTEQLASDGNAEMLYQEIQKEKQRLVKEGKIKKEKPLSEIAENDIPFDIPENWKWVYLGDIFSHNTGKALNQSNTEGMLLSYITTSNLYWDGFVLDNLRSMKFAESEMDKCTIKKGDLLVCEGGDIGRSAIWPYDYEMRIQNHIHKLRAYVDVCTKYYWYVLYLYKLSELIGGKGIGIQGLSSNALHKLIIPLPPLAEQKRIVEKLDQLLPLSEAMNAEIAGGESV